MNDFESSLTSALRAEVEEAAACVDGIRAAQRLESGLDRVDRARRRRIWVGVVAVGAAAALISVAALAGRATDHATPIQLIEPPPTSTPAPPPTSSKPSPSESFAAVLSVHLLAGSFDSIGGLAVGPTGTVYVSDFSSTLHRSVIRAITPAGHVTTIAGQPATRWDAGFGAVAVDGSGNVYVAAGHAIRKIGPDGQMSTLAGGATPGTVDGIGSKARFDGILGMAISPTGDLYVAGAGVVRKVTLRARSTRFQRAHIRRRPLRAPVTVSDGPARSPSVLQARSTSGRTTIASARSLRMGRSVNWRRDPPTFSSAG